MKKLWQEHKKAICFIGGCVILGTAAYLIIKNKYHLTSKSNNLISWKPNNGSMNLERVKEILEANKDNSACFAIFREGPNPSEYVTVMLDNDLIIPPIRELL